MLAFVILMFSCIMYLHIYYTCTNNTKFKPEVYYFACLVHKFVRHCKRHIYMLVAINFTDVNDKITSVILHHFL